MQGGRKMNILGLYKSNMNSGEIYDIHKSELARAAKIIADAEKAYADSIVNLFKDGVYLNNWKKFYAAHPKFLIMDVYIASICFGAQKDNKYSQEIATYSNDDYLSFKSFSLENCPTYDPLYSFYESDEVFKEIFDDLTDELSPSEMTEIAIPMRYSSHPVNEDSFLSDYANLIGTEVEYEHDSFFDTYFISQHFIGVFFEFYAFLEKNKAHLNEIMRAYMLKEDIIR